MLKFEDLYVGATLVHCYPQDTDLEPLDATANIIQHEYIITGIDIHSEWKMSYGRYVNATITIKSKSQGCGGKYTYDSLKRDNAILGSQWHKELLEYLRQREITRLEYMIDDAVEKIRQWKTMRT
jgi:hypothetical protein